VTARTPDSRESQLRAQVKHEIRRRMRAVRNALPPEATFARSKKIAEHVIALEQYQTASTVAAFASMRCEVDTRPVVEHAWNAGKQVALPRVEGEDLALVLVDAATELVEGAFSVPEPSADALPIALNEVDFVLVPALAVDPLGHRIGYGGGYYDRLLPRLENAVSCCVAYDFQLISEAPALPTDAPVQIVVTDQRVILVV
jgi:5-formyltetrahydrofolate cyclo-ligase